MWTMLMSTALAAAPAAGPEQAVRAFVDAADTQDVSALQAVLHEDFRVLARMPDGWSMLDRATYLSLIEAGTFGGVKRKTRLDSVQSTGELATVVGSLSSKAATFESSWTVVQVDGAWKVVQDATIFQPK